MLLTAITFLVMISLLVAAHEYGHYLFARLFGMDVEEFAIGFGKQKWVYRVKNGTEFTLRPWPLGGFVRIKGMVPEEDGSEIDVPNGFYSKPPLHRFVVLFAGPVFSVLAGVILLTGLFVSIPRHPTNDPIIGEVLAGKPAAVAGLKAGDRIVAIDGKPVDSWYAMIREVRERPNQTLAFEYERDGQRARAEVATYLAETATPLLDENLEPTGKRVKHALIGAAAELRRSTPGEAVGEAVMYPVNMVAGLAGTFTSVDRFKSEIGGPIAIVQATSDQVQKGPADVMLLAALLSISLGIFNLFPFSPLDGGQMVVAVAEMLRGGRRLSMRAQGMISVVGLTLVGMLVLSVFAVDIGRLGKKPPADPPAASQTK